MSKVYQRESEKLLQWERRIVQAFDASLFVSDAEATGFKKLAPESAYKVSVFTNSVDAHYVAPEGEFATPFSSPQIAVTGHVEDVRPYLAHTASLVVPLRIGRGLQNKVLEDMAMANTVLYSSRALKGIEAEIGKEVLLAESPESFATACLQTLRGEIEIGRVARANVFSTDDWGVRLSKLDQLMA